MIWKLQRKTLLPLQIFGYGITLFIGITIALITGVAYSDISPILHSESDVFNDNVVVVSKEVSLLKTLDKKRIYFTNQELKELKDQDFVKGVSKFNKATNYRISLTSDDFNVYTELFFESIPDKFLDIKPEDWAWELGSNFVPIMMPEDYLQLYNLGFAESQGLPVLSKKTISLAEFNINLDGDERSQTFKSRIVGFSSKINTILVPEDFLNWANKEFGKHAENNASRILVEFNDPNDDRIIGYFASNNYAVNKEKLERNKLTYFFKLSFLFVFMISIIIIILSIAFVLLSVNLIFQRNKQILINLYNIGYKISQITYFYKLLISLITLISVILSLLCTIFIRGMYSERLIAYFEIEINNSDIYMLGGMIILILILFLNLLISRRIKKIVIN